MGCWGAPTGQPDFNLIQELWWGGAYSCSAYAPYLAAAANVVITGAGAYYLDDFLAMNPKFFGTPFSPAPAATTTSGLNTFTVSSADGLAVGQFFTNPNFPKGTTITAISGTNLTASNNATASGVAPMQVYNSPLLPLVVVQTFINNARASLMQGRWFASWSLAMALYIAHYCTMWLMTDGTPPVNAEQAVAQGLARGMITSESVDGVSASYLNVMQDFMEWGAWNQTAYGQQFVTLAAVAGMGVMYIQ